MTEEDNEEFNGMVFLLETHHIGTDILFKMKNLIQNQQAELEKKDKIIDLAVRELYKKAHISTKCYLQTYIEECMKYKNCTECLKQYFEKEIENE